VNFSFDILMEFEFLKHFQTFHVYHQVKTKSKWCWEYDFYIFFFKKKNFTFNGSPFSSNTIFWIERKLVSKTTSGVESFKTINK